jgi:GNAT superfamily N-acetyltransferase
MRFKRLRDNLENPKMNLAVEALDWQTMSDRDRDECAKLSELVWPPEVIAMYQARVSPSAPPRPFQFASAERPRTFVLRHGGAIVAKAAILPRRIAIAAAERTVLALAGVASHPAHRGKHYGKAVVQAAFQLVASGDFDLAFFQTSHQVRPFYEALGCRRVENRLVNSLAREPERNPFWDDAAIIYPATVDWPSGTIDTLGPGW